MTDLIENLEEKWDMVLFDSPPLVAVTDATMVSKAIDKIVIVVKVAHTDKRRLSIQFNPYQMLMHQLGELC